MTENITKNPVFDSLVREDDDLEGLTAYGLYKRHKRRWAQDHEGRTGSPPTADDNLKFAQAVAIEDQLQRYRKDAQDILIAFSNQIVEEQRATLEREGITVRIEKAASSIERQSSLSQQLISGVLSTLITTAALILLAIGARLFGIDIIDGISSLTAPVDAAAQSIQPTVASQPSNPQP